jgi:hypothetical protein
VLAFDVAGSGSTTAGSACDEIWLTPASFSFPFPLSVGWSDEADALTRSDGGIFGSISD